jgi:DnaK suppressor protein
VKDNSRKNSLKDLLIEKKRKMWNELRDDVFRKLGNEYSAQFDIPNDLEDLSVIDAVEDLGLTVSDIRKEELLKIEDALRRIEKGAYGLCENCGAEIDGERLKADVSAARCINCQGELEKEEGKKKPTL